MYCVNNICRSMILSKENTVKRIIVKIIKLRHKSKKKNKKLSKNGGKKKKRMKDDNYFYRAVATSGDSKTVPGGASKSASSIATAVISRIVSVSGVIGPTV